MSIELLELAAAALGDLLDEVVFVGGAMRKEVSNHSLTCH